MDRTRWGALACMLALTAALIGWTASGDSQGAAPPQTLQPDGPRVQILSLADLEPWDTDPRAENNWGPAWGAWEPASESDMTAILAETTTKDGTIVRLYATADGRIDGAVSRPEGTWMCFLHLYRGGDVGPNFADGATLTSYEDVMGRSGFLLRTDGYRLEAYDYWYYWFDEAGDLRVLSACMDPLSLDLDGDGAEELVFGFDDFRSALCFYFERDGALYRAEGLPGPVEGLEPSAGGVKLMCRDEDGSACAVTFTGDALRVETGVDWEPLPEGARAPALPETPPAGTVTVAAPDGWVTETGGTAFPQLWSLLAGTASGDPVLVPDPQGPDRATAYIVTFPLEDGGSVVWTLDSAGRCRLSTLEGTYRILRTGGGSPGAHCWQTVAIYSAASRTSRDYDGQGRWLGESLAWSALGRESAGGGEKSG